MSVININDYKVKKCAFCKYWYDPTNSAIEPVAPNIGLWKIVNDSQKCLCTRKNANMSAGLFCMNYVYKL